MREVRDVFVFPYYMEKVMKLEPDFQNMQNLFQNLQYLPCRAIFVWQFEIFFLNLQIQIGKYLSQ